MPRLFDYGSDYANKSKKKAKSINTGRVGHTGKKSEHKTPNIKNSGDERARYRLIFEDDSKAEIQNRIEQSREPLNHLTEKYKEVALESIYPQCHDLLLPRRPTWSFSMTKSELESNEARYFNDFVTNLKGQPWSQNLAHFEHNIDTWRQLWRVLEKSDVISMIADSRFPVLHFVPSLYDYVVHHLKKPMILILNKVDIATPEHVVSWKNYFTTKYPELNIILFTNFPKDPEVLKENAKKIMSKVRRKKGGFICYGAKEFLEACQSLYPNKSFDSWKRKVEEETYDKFDKTRENQKEEVQYEDLFNEWDNEKTQNKFLTIGLVGFPNVGKSSFINGLKGRKVVSVSKTPGHTKYFQTIFITNDVVLCDCPGLVFPSLMDKQLQIISGVFPISQVREPYSSIGYMAERVDLVKLLNLKQQPENIDAPWSAWSICEAWAKLRGFRAAKSGHLDTYRAANHLLRLVTIGKINFHLLPPGYSILHHQFINEPETIHLYQKLKQYSDPNAVVSYPDSVSDSSDDETFNSNTNNGTAESCTLSNRFSALRIE